MAAKENKEKKDSVEIVPRAPRNVMAPFEEMEHWFEEAFRRPFFAPSWLPRIRFPELVGEVTPSVDIYEDANNVIVKAEIPGMKKEDIEVNITENTITISGQKKAEEKVERQDYYRLERSFGSFSRKLRLPVETLTDKAMATFKDGVLEVKIPKAATVKAKKITID